MPRPSPALQLPGCTARRRGAGWGGGCCLAGPRRLVPEGLNRPASARSTAGTAPMARVTWLCCAAGVGLSGPGPAWDLVILRPEGDWLVWAMAGGPVPSDPAEFSSVVCVPFRERLVPRRASREGCLQELFPETGRTRIPGSWYCWNLFVRHFIWGMWGSSWVLCSPISLSSLCFPPSSAWRGFQGWILGLLCPLKA